MTADGRHSLSNSAKFDNEIDDQPDFSPVGLAVSPVSKTTTVWGRLKISFGKLEEADII